MDLENILITKRDFAGGSLNKPASKKIYFQKCEKPLVSIIIPAFNKYKCTKSCLYYLYKNTENIKYEVILADDNSADETHKLSDEFVNLKVIKSPEREGFLKNVNNAVKHAKGKYICILHNDVIPKPNWLDVLLETIEKEKNVGIVSPKVRFPKSPMVEEGFYVTSLGSMEPIINNEETMAGGVQKAKEVNCGAECVILLRKSDWDKVGGLDEVFAYNLFYEYADLSFTFKYKLNLKTIYQPMSEVVHFIQASHNWLYDCNNRLLFYYKWKKEIDELNKHQDSIEKSKGININICFGLTDNYSQHVGVTITSILLNANKNDNYHFYLVSDYISEDNKNKLQELESIKDFEIDYVEVNKQEFIDYNMNWISHSAYYRLKIFELIKEDKILYLDSDLIVRKDIRDLYNTDISECLFAAIPDVTTTLNNKIIRRKYQYSSIYVNSGVMLINLKRCVEEKIYNKLFDFAKKNFQKENTISDQDIINTVMHDRIKNLDIKWNGMFWFENNYDQEYYKKVSKDPSILHWITQNKPWVKNSDPHKKNEYFQYLKFTPWFDEFMKYYYE